MDETCKTTEVTYISYSVINPGAGGLIIEPHDRKLISGRCLSKAEAEEYLKLELGDGVRFVITGISQVRKEQYQFIVAPTELSPTVLESGRVTPDPALVPDPQEDISVFEGGDDPLDEDMASVPVLQSADAEADQVIAEVFGDDGPDDIAALAEAMYGNEQEHPLEDPMF